MGGKGHGVCGGGDRTPTATHPHPPSRPGPFIMNLRILLFKFKKCLIRIHKDKGSREKCRMTKKGAVQREWADKPTTADSFTPIKREVS